jgi:hypothetical protein
VVYAAFVLALLAPYLVFIQVNGGLRMYFRDAFAWAERDRGRAPLVWPSVFEETPEATVDAASAPLPVRAVESVRANFAAWMFYVELAVPAIALVVLAVSRDGFRGDWPHAIPKLTCVAILGLVLNAGFLRHPLGARLADPSVPHTILLAWLLAALAKMLVSRSSLREGLQSWAWLVRAGFAAAMLIVVFVSCAGFSRNLHDRLAKAALVRGPAEAIERAGRVRQQLREDWQLASWEHREDRPDLINLSLYVNACTAPDDRVFIQHYAPQVLALARRAFAGGHADLRPGFFTTNEDQRLTLDRLRRQRVPIVLLETGDGYVAFRESFPLIATYFDEHYTLAGTRVFDRRFGVQLFVRKGSRPHRMYEPLGWPCFS